MGGLIVGLSSTEYSPMYAITFDPAGAVQRIVSLSPGISMASDEGKMLFMTKFDIWAYEVSVDTAFLFTTVV
ncbi:hypothetical protein SDC9_121962 [bioreactor metagenome]|uniref:Uncharacterized protein n=1 Tax=bioreactor metagenome TaxID=1076179 RepID=A0A645CDI6_9ZZZZ